MVIEAQCNVSQPISRSDLYRVGDLVDHNIFEVAEIDNEASVFAAQSSGDVAMLSRRQRNT